jgi:DNA-binding LacI/PurR family transcriptional regulator
LLAGFRAAGRRVPNDIAVAGYDGTELSEALELTTVEQPFAETGSIATALLLDLLDGTARPTQHVDLTPSSESWLATAARPVAWLKASAGPLTLVRIHDW